VFTDPQSVTVSSVAQTLPRVSTGDRSATYTKDDETYSLTISHTTTNRGRVRRLVRLDNAKVAVDPFVANQSRKFTASTYLVIEEPADGAYSNSELLAISKGFVAYLTDANLTKVIAGES
jgi:hypothetical protein